VSAKLLDGQQAAVNLLTRLPLMARTAKQLKITFFELPKVKPLAVDEVHSVVPAPITDNQVHL